MECKYKVSVVIPTLNAEKYLERSLGAIRNQNFDQEQIEILVADGGSTDKTREIARKYGACVLENPNIRPNDGILVGLQAAQGKYMMRMGADEVYEDPEKLNRSMELFRLFPDVKVSVVDCLKTPADRPLSSAYYNYCGDPFTFFVLRRSSMHMVDCLCKTQQFEQQGEFYKVKFEKGDIIPIADGCCMFDLQYLREKFPAEVNTLEFISSYAHAIVGKTGCMGFVKNETICHDMYCDFKTLLKKLKFRVVTNVHYADESGYMAYSKGQKKIARKKYLYPLYCLSVVGPIVDALKISRETKRNAGIVHFASCYYVLGQIVGQYALKILGKKPGLAAYGQ